MSFQENGDPFYIDLPLTLLGANKIRFQLEFRRGWYLLSLLRLRCKDGDIRRDCLLSRAVFEYNGINHFSWSKQAKLLYVSRDSAALGVSISGVGTEQNAVFSRLEIAVESLEGERLRSALQHLQKDIDNAVSSQSRHQQLWAFVDQNNSELDKKTAQCLALESELAQCNCEFAALESRLSSTSERLGEVWAELTQIRNSRRWQIGSNIHRLTGRIRAGTRRHLRRVVKSVYWLLTPHKIPARLEYRRMMRQAAAQASSPQGDSVPGPLDLRTTFRFHPEPNSCQGFAHEKGRYSFTTESQGYVYIPPRKPLDLGHQIANLQTQFSVVVPIFNTPAWVFNAMVNSVKSQWYPYWELILVDDCSTAAHVRHELDEAASGDSRISVINLTHNHGISGATNEGLAHATSDYVVFLDHDDELTEDCLFELAKAIAQNDPDYLYSDEDKVDPSGAFVMPFFKPDWSPDTLMSTMYTCHVSCVRRELLGRIGFLRPEFDGSQDWDLILRVTEQTNRITHIPKVLYHWRIISGSAAGATDAKPFAIEAGRRARTEALTRRGHRGTIKELGNFHHYSRVIYEIKGSPRISIIIPSKNNGPVLKTCIDSIYTLTNYSNYEFIVIDNGSTDNATLAYLRSLNKRANLKVLRDESAFNWSLLNNSGVQQSSGDLLLFLNDDTEAITPAWLTEMVGYAQLEHIGAVGAKLLYPPGDLVQHNGVVNLYNGPTHALRHQSRNDPGPFCRNFLEFNYLAVTGACLMVERKKFDFLGQFDESFPVAYNDVEFCFRAVKKGLYNVVCQGAELIHHESLSRGNDHVYPQKLQRLNADRKRLYQTHPEFYLVDPFHSPNLHPNDSNYGVPG